MNDREGPEPLTRRRFIRAAAWSTAIACSRPTISRKQPARAREAVEQKPVVDTHMHVWADDLRKFPCDHPYQPDFEGPPCSGSVEMLVDDMDRHGVTHAVLVQVIYHGWDNSYLVHCLEQYPGRFAAQGLIDPTAEDVADKLEYWVAERGLAGMRFSPIYYLNKDEWLTAPATHRLWKKATELGAVFNFFIATGQLPKLARMVERFPEVPVVVDHLSQIDLGSEDPQPQLNKLLALARFPNVWVKVSELTSVSKSGKYPFTDAFPWVRQVYDAFGPDRLLWGTGYPGAARAHFNRPALAAELDLIRREIAFFTSEDREKILGRNAAQLWKLEA